MAVKSKRASGTKSKSASRNRQRRPRTPKAVKVEAIEQPPATRGVCMFLNLGAPFGGGVFPA